MAKALTADEPKTLAAEDAAEEIAEDAVAVLLVDDDRETLMWMEELLRGHGLRLLTAESGERALELFEEEHIDIVVSDERMDGMTGTELLREVRQRFPHVRRALHTAHPTSEVMLAAINDGQVHRALSKPSPPEELRGAVLQLVAGILEG